MQYPEEIVLEGADLNFWKTHSEVIADLAGNDDELTMESGFFKIINTGSELVDEDVYPPESSNLYWQMFVDLVQGNQVGRFNSSGVALLNTRKGYTKKRLVRLLDYLAFPTNKESLDALKSYMRSHQINYVRETVPRGIGIRKPAVPVRKYPDYSRYNYNYNDYDNYNYLENNSNNNEKSIVVNNNYVSDNENNLKRILATLPTKFVPYSKTEKQRKIRHRKHSRLTKRMKPKNMRKPKKDKRTSKTKVNTRKVNNNNNSMNTFNNNSTFSFDD